MRDLPTRHFELGLVGAHFRRKSPDPSSLLDSAG
jgi:hypothetical protein